MIPDQFMLESLGGGESSVKVIADNRSCEIFMKDTDFITQVLAWAQTLPKSKRMVLLGTLKLGLEVEQPGIHAMWVKNFEKQEMGKPVENEYTSDINDTPRQEFSR